jgi:hypothetical protein
MVSVPFPFVFSEIGDRTMFSTDIPLELRWLIGDVNAPQVYTDASLLQLATISAKMVNREMGFVIPYTIDIANSTVTPDPTDPNTLNDDFSTLICLKAVVILAQAKIASAPTGALVVDGRSKVDTTLTSRSLTEVLKAAQDAYINYKTQMAVNQAGRVILSPFRLGIHQGVYNFGYGSARQCDYGMFSLV